MFGFFKKKHTVITANATDWSFLSADMHSHFIPGIDDGPQTMEESISLLKDMQDAGFRKVITTPHISMDYFPETEALIASGLEALRQEARLQGLSIELEAAAEYMIDENLLDKLHKNKPLFTINDQYLLVEMGFVQESPLLHQAIFEIQAAGYTPILAHPERYNFYHDRPLTTITQLKNAGCLLQLNTIA
ncbi:MAG: capsular biosynthesis protein, partial [Chitinophagaceae bacterium]